MHTGLAVITGTEDRQHGYVALTRGTDTFARINVNQWGNEGGQSAFALIPYVKLPTAPPGLGNGAVEGGVITPLSFSLPDNYTLLFNGELDALRDNAGGGYHPNMIALANLSRPIVKDVTVLAELWTDLNLDPDRFTRQASLDLAVEWTVRPNLQLDWGVNIGLTRETPGIQLYTGLSQRF